MKSWEEIILEAKSKREKELEDRVSELGDIPSSLKKDKKKGKKKKEDSAYTKYLNKQLKFKAKKYEEQKRRQLEKIKEKEKAQKERASKESLEKAKQSLAGINVRTVGKSDSSVTGVQKSVETAGSIAKGLTGAAAHGIAALVKRRKAKKEAEQRAQEAQGIYHGHHPKNIMGAVTDKTPESKSRRGIRHRAGGAHELEGKTKDIEHVGHKGLLSAAHRQRLRKERKENNK